METKQKVEIMKDSHHLNYRFDVLMRISVEDLEELTEKPAKEVRAELAHIKAAGEVYIPSAGCEGFDPVNGCLGHGV